LTLICCYRADIAAARRKFEKCWNRPPAAALYKGEREFEAVPPSPYQSVSRTRSFRNYPQVPWMNWDRIQGNWKQFSGKVREKWGQLTDDDVTKIAGRRDQLVGKVRESYGIAKDDAEKQVRDFEKSLEHSR
jgi:uncharacterized protein YjbJ (UPF0337 family)